jgi:integrase/recombinase XerD
MVNRVKYKFILRTDQIAKSGGQNIYLYANVNGKKIYLSIGHEIPVKFWNEADQVVKNGFRDTARINQKITSITKELSIILQRADASGAIVTTDNFKAVLKNPGHNDDFIVFMQKTTEKEAADFKIAKQTEMDHLSLIDKVRKLKGRIPFDQITVKLWSDIEASLTKSGCGKNTVFKYFADLQVFINKAIRDGIITINPWLTVVVKKEKTRREFLDLSEIKKLENYFRSPINKKQKNACAAFLFGCYTGLRFSDLKKLQWTNIIDDWILFTIKKTATPDKIPLNIPALNILKMLKKEKENIFTLYQDVNTTIKAICAEVGINKKITFHCSRHTFATISLLLSKDIVTVSKLLGHSNISTTQIYAHIIDESKLNVVNLWNEKPVKKPVKNPG